MPGSSMRTRFRAQRSFVKLTPEDGGFDRFARLGGKSRVSRAWVESKQRKNRFAFRLSRTGEAVRIKHPRRYSRWVRASLYRRPADTKRMPRRRHTYANRLSNAPARDQTIRLPRNDSPSNAYETRFSSPPFNVRCSSGTALFSSLARQEV